MSNRAQCAVGFLVGASVDLVFYAGAVAALVAAVAATGAAFWWRSR